MQTFDTALALPGSTPRVDAVVEEPWTHRLLQDLTGGRSQGDLFGRAVPPGTQTAFRLTQSTSGTKAGVAEDRRALAALPWSGDAGRTS